MQKEKKRYLIATTTITLYSDAKSLEKLSCVAKVRVVRSIKGMPSFKLFSFDILIEFHMFNSLVQRNLIGRKKSFMTFLHEIIF